jgi:hypothetical protein
VLLTTNIYIDIVIGRSMRSNENGLVIIGFEGCVETRDVLIRKIKRLTKVIGILEQRTSLKEVSELTSEQIKLV